MSDESIDEKIRALQGRICAHTRRRCARALDCRGIKNHQRRRARNKGFPVLGPATHMLRGNAPQTKGMSYWGVNEEET
jgi:hypothetical protein